MFKKSTAAALVSSAAAAQADHWAVLVAGSNTYANYRHQADICHAYQIAKANGIPEDQIITIAYDDIAHNSRNPYKGQIFNKPTEAGTPGVDVYAGCKLDYTKGKANPDTVYKVLRGDESAGGKVLKSNKDSKIFFYYADHGAPGFVMMPAKDDLIGTKKLYADKLHRTFEYMKENDMYD